MSNLTDFFEDTTKEFNITVYYDDVAQNITGDVVTLYIKQNPDDTNANATITKAADVTTSGATGIAIFALTPTETAKAVGAYYYEITWTLSTGKHFVIDNGVVNIKNKLVDN